MMLWQGFAGLGEYVGGFSRIKPPVLLGDDLLGKISTYSTPVGEIMRIITSYVYSDAL